MTERTYDYLAVVVTVLVINQDIMLNILDMNAYDGRYDML